MIFFVIQTHSFINDIDLLKCTEKKNKFQPVISTFHRRVVFNNSSRIFTRFYA